MKTILILLSLICSKDPNFQTKIDSILKNPILKPATTGIEIYNPDQEEIIYSKNSEKLFVPASVVKIITSLAALSLLKPEYRFKTEVFYDLKNLYIKGYGDPSLCTHDLDEIANKIIEHGINQVENIIYDDSYFDSQETGEGWIEEPEAFGFNARISALSLNMNCIKIFIKPGNSFGDSVEFLLYPETDFAKVINPATTGYRDSLFVKRELISNKNHFILKGCVNIDSPGQTFTRHIDNPSLYTATVFKEILQDKGIEVNGEITKGEITGFCKKICSHFSEPLTHIIYYMNKESLNFYADQILKTFGAEFLNPPGSFKKGEREIRSFLTHLGLTELEFKIYNGSGLSRYNLISPHGIVKVLSCALSEFEIAPEFLSSLPTAGVNGTLEHRLRSSYSIRRIRAKTGTMLGISSLSGYILTNKDTLIIFSIITNNFTSSPYWIKKIQDQIVELIITEL